MLDNRAPVIGWWQFDAETRALVNRFSGQRVGFEAAVDDTATNLRFSYADPEILYPVLLTRRYDRNGALTWSIDHLESAAAWRRSTNADTEIPPYGLWRRVDECLFDALSCWPETAEAGLRPHSVDTSGGWWNGAWSPRLRRVGYGGAGPERSLEDGVRPFLEPLASQPLSWRFVDATEAVAGAGLAGIRVLADGRRYLPREDKLTGFEAVIPHLLRSDGKAVMFPYRVRSAFGWDGDYVPRAEFFYADEDVFLRLDGLSRSGSGGRWEFELDELIELGTRRDPSAPRPPSAEADLPRGLVCFRQIHSWRGPTLQPLPRLAQRLTAALIDGWLAWRGSRLRLLDDPAHLAWLAGQKAPYPVPPLELSGIGLDAKERVRVKQRYTGGRFVGGEMEGALPMTA